MVLNKSPTRTRIARGPSQTRFYATATYIPANVSSGVASFAAQETGANTAAGTGLAAGITRSRGVGGKLQTRISLRDTNGQRDIQDAIGVQPLSDGFFHE